MEKDLSPDTTLLLLAKVLGCHERCFNSKMNFKVPVSSEVTHKFRHALLFSIKSVVLQIFNLTRVIISAVGHQQPKQH
jgi:hypothetical protein